MSASVLYCSKCRTPLTGASLECPVCAFNLALGFDSSPSDSEENWDDLLNPDAAPTALGVKRFGRFELLEEIGRGGMGVVYQALEAGSHRVVALKILLPQAASAPGLVGRFRAEAEAIASLDHPHILPLYASGERDGLPFFSMKLASKGSLATHLSDYAGHSRKSARLIATLARAVHHAHQRGILHRDLKPANILIDDQGTAYVADFGIAKWIGQDQGATLTGIPLGTPAYMAPEQAVGKSTDLTVAVDVYGLGAIFYELLTQRQPFLAHTTLDLLRQVAEESPPEPCSLEPSLSRDLQTICLKCLAKSPSARYTSAEALAADLENWLADRPITARPVGRGERVLRWARRNPALTFLSALVLASLVALAVGTGLALKRIAAERNAATTQLRAALLAEAQAAQLSGRAGQRYDALDALKKAAAIQPGLDLRNEALAALALPDVRTGPIWNLRYASNSPVAFTSTGDRFIVESVAGGLTLRRATDGGVLCRYAAPKGNPRALYIASLSADDTKFAVRFTDDRVRVYALDRAEPLWELTSRPVCQMNAVVAYDFAFSPDGREVAVGLPTSGISFHEAATGKEISRLSCGFVPAVLLYSPDSRKVAAVGLREYDLGIYDRLTGHLERMLTHPKSIIHAAWRPDGKQIAVACFDNRIYLWNAVTGAQDAILRGHKETPCLLAWRPDSRVLASSGRDVTVRFWDAQDGAPLLTVPEVSGEPCLRFSSDSRSLAYAGESASLGQLELHLDDLRREWLHGMPGDYFDTSGGMDVSSDGRLIVVSYSTGVRLMDAQSGEILARLPLPPSGDNTAQFTPKADALVYSTDKTGTWRRSLVWKSEHDLEIGSAFQVDKRPGFYVTEVRGDPAKVSLLGEDSATASIVPLLGGGPSVDLPLAGEPQSSTLHPKGRFVVTTDREGEKGGESDARVWDGITGRAIRRLNLGMDGAAHFSPTGTLLWVNGGNNSRLLRWPELVPAFPQPMAGFDAWFSPNQSLLAIAADEAHITLLRLRDGEILGALPGSANPFARFSVDDKRLFIFMNFNVYVWDLPAVRRELAAVGLDWDGSLAPSAPPSGGPVRVVMRN